ncbi:MAG: glycosyltransferase family 4 protein [Mycobacteriales bacterium]
MSVREGWQRARGASRAGRQAPAPGALSEERAPSERLAVLVVAPDLPYPPSWGFGMRVYQLVRALAADHSVTLLCHARPDLVHFAEPLRAFCTEVRVVERAPEPGLARRVRQARSLLSATPYHASGMRTRQLQAALDDCLRATDFGVVQIESSPLAGLRYRTGAALVLDEHNVESELLQRMHEAERHPGRRLFNLVEAVKYRRLEHRVWSRASGCVTTSEREREHVRQRVPAARTAVVPNGVDPDHFRPGEAPVRPDTLVFTGVLSYRPNYDAARYFIDEILPRVRTSRPGVELTVVGYGEPKDLAALAAPGVTVTGWVDDVRPHLAEAAAVVVPIRMGSGTRLKVVEALSMRKPMVSTSVGCEGIDVEPGRHLLVADDPDRFAAAVCTVLADPALGERLGRAGRQLVVDNYSWQRSGRLLAELYRELVPAGGPGLSTPAGQGEPG